MINVYKSFAKRWQNTVRRYALGVWRNRTDEKLSDLFDDRAETFAKEYRKSLEDGYRRKGINVYRGTIDGKVNDWLLRQYALKDTLEVMAKEKKNKLVADEIERIEKDETIDLQESINKIYALKDDENVYRVFSFAEHFKDKAEQIGDDEAFALGRDINESVIQDNSDRYFWRTQNDARVRKTHMKLAEKCFLFADPPTTVDKYGNIHKGNPGTDYGCRCWAEIAPPRTKVKRDYVVKE